MSVWEETQRPEHGRGDPAVPVRHPAEDRGPADTVGAGLDLSIFAEIGVHLGRLVDGMHRDREERARLAALAPQDHWIAGQGTVNAAGQAFIDLGSVPQGRVWQIRRIVVGGTLATSKPAGSAFLYAVGAEPVTLPTIGVVDSWPSFSTGPQGSTYGTHQLFLVQPEHLWVAVTGGTTGTQWVVAVRVEDYPAELYYRLHPTSGLAEV